MPSPSDPRARRSSSRYACPGCCWPPWSAAAWRWWGPRCSPYFGTRWPTPASSAWAPARRWARCWPSTSASRPPSSSPCPSTPSRARSSPCSRCISSPGAPAERSLSGLLLTGIAVSALLSAGTSVLLVATEEFRVKTVLFWLAGGLEGRGWTHVQAAAAFVLAGVALLVALGRPLDVLSLGEEEASSLGLPVRATRFLLLGHRRARGRGLHRRGRGRALRRPHGAPCPSSPRGTAGTAPAPRRVPGRGHPRGPGGSLRAHRERPLRAAPGGGHRLRGRALLPVRAARERGTRIERRSSLRDPAPGRPRPHRPAGRAPGARWRRAWSSRPARRWP